VIDKADKIHGKSNVFFLTVFPCYRVKKAVFAKKRPSSPGTDHIPYNQPINTYIFDSSASLQDVFTRFFAKMTQKFVAILQRFVAILR
jgi:hypothetical protein